jgi:tRNA G37 N-methylase Trm5
MPLPRTSQAYLPIALTAVRPGGRLHFYDFQSAGTFRQSIEKIDRACGENDRKLITAEIAVCGHCSPRTYRICVDARIE